MTIIAIFTLTGVRAKQNVECCEEAGRAKESDREELRTRTMIAHRSLDHKKAIGHAFTEVAGVDDAYLHVCKAGLIDVLSKAYGVEGKPLGRSEEDCEKFKHINLYSEEDGQVLFEKCHETQLAFVNKLKACLAEGSEQDDESETDAKQEIEGKKGAVLKEEEKDTVDEDQQMVDSEVKVVLNFGELEKCCAEKGTVRSEETAEQRSALVRGHRALAHKQSITEVFDNLETFDTIFARACSKGHVDYITSRVSDYLGDCKPLKAIDQHGTGAGEGNYNTCKAAQKAYIEQLNSCVRSAIIH